MLHDHFPLHVFSTCNFNSSFSLHLSCFSSASRCCSRSKLFKSGNVLIVFPVMVRYRVTKRNKNVWNSYNSIYYASIIEGRAELCRIDMCLLSVAFSVTSARNNHPEAGCPGKVTLSLLDMYFQCGRWFCS